MTDVQRDDLIEELSIYSPSQVRSLAVEYLQVSSKDQYLTIYEFLREKLQIDGYWEKVGLM